MGLVVFARSRYGGFDDVKDVEAAVTCLVEGFLKDFIAQTVTLDVHLGGCDTVTCACHLEVHVAEVVFVTEDVGEHCPLVAFGVGDKTHGDTADGLLHLDTGVKQRECAGAYGGH